MNEDADDEFDQAVRLSSDEAEQEEGRHVVAAVLQSKMDAPPLSGDDAVIFRLTRVTRPITQTLLEAPELAEARARVTEAGCELKPGFASMATFLIPITEEHFAELGLSLRPHHVIALRAARSALESALARVPSKQRPQVKADHRADKLQPGCLASPSPPSEACAGMEDPNAAVADGVTSLLVEERAIGIVVPVVRHTFIHIPDMPETSETSDCVHSAPCAPAAGSMDREPRNPRRH